MEEQTTWRGHSFTLFVFGGIVFLCATFFVLGMLVGRSQGQKYASANAAGTAKSQTPDAGKRADFTLDNLREDQTPPPTLVAPGEAPQPEEPSPSSIREEPAHSNVSIQVEALQQRSAAERLVVELKKLGFTALIVPPGTSDKFYRVQVGPYEDAPDAESTRQKLASAGYHPIIIKK